MFARVLVLVAFIASALAFAPSRRFGMTMTAEKLSSKIAKAGISALMGISLIAPVAPVLADGAVSASTVYRAKNNYGRRIKDLSAAASSGNFAAFEDKKAVTAFDLFISQTNARNSATDKERSKAEKAIEANIYAAVKAKDASKLKASFSEFIKVGELESLYKPGELGQTDSSGYSPTWGTSSQYIYQR